MYILSAPRLIEHLRMAGSAGAALGQDRGAQAGGHVRVVALSTQGWAARHGAASFVCSLCALRDGN